MRLRSYWDHLTPYLAIMLVSAISLAVAALSDGLNAAKPASSWIFCVVLSCVLLAAALYMYFAAQEARREKVVHVELYFDGKTAAKIEEVQRFFEIGAEAATSRGLGWLYQGMIWSREGKELVVHDPRSGVDKTLDWTAQDHDDWDRAEA